MEALIKTYLDKEAVVLDVRTVKEWEEDGHNPQAKLIVLDTLIEHLDEIKSWEKPIITVCRSGIRSENAREILESVGIDVINGGTWQNVAQYL